MKTTVLLCFICLLFTSCYSYKTVNPVENELITGQRYKIYIQDGKHKKGKLQAVVDDSVTLALRNGKTFDIPYSKIEKTKKRKFSVNKTVGLPMVIVGGTVG